MNTVVDAAYLTIHVTDFDPDKIYIPLNCYDHQAWILRALVCFYPTNKKKNEVNGHYVCFTRIENGWLEISDSDVTERKDLNLNGAYLFFLEKCNP